MAPTDKTASKLRGLGVHDPRFSSIWLSKSVNLTQAEPLPGIPEASDSYDMVLRSSGTQSGGSDLEIQTLEGGNPGRENRAGFVWKNRSDGSTTYRGKDPISVISHWEPVVWLNGSAAVTDARQAHAVTLSDETVIVAYRYTVGSTHGVRVRARSDGGTWSSAVTVDNAALNQSDRFPCLVVLPDDRLMLYCWLTNTSTNLANIKAFTSTDKGVTWTQVSSGIISTSIDVSGSAGSGNAGFELGKIRGAYASGQVLLIGEIIDHDTSKLCQYWVQLASHSLGVDFTQIELIESGAYFLARPEVVALNGQFYIYSIDATAQIIKQIKCSNAYFKISTLAGNSTTYSDNQSSGDYSYGTLDSTNDFLTAGDLAACADSMGNLYIIVGAYSGGSSTHQSIIYVSRDAGENWLDGGAATTLTNEGGVWWQSLDSATYPTDYAITPCQGRLVVLGSHAANPGNEDDSISAFYLGGWSTVTMPDRGSFNDPLNQATWSRTWVPFDVPSDVGWTASGTASTASISSEGTFEITTASSNTKYYAISGSDATSTVTQGMIVRWAVEITALVPSHTVDAVMSLRLADGSADYEVGISLTYQTITVTDSNASSTLGTASVDTTDGPIEMLAAFSSAGLQVWYRSHNSNSDREWSVAASTTSLTNNSGSPSANNQILWGNKVAGTSDWPEVHVSVGADTGDQMSSGFTNPDDLMPERFAGYGFTTHVDEGLKLNAADGPTMPGDTWNIATRYGYSVDRILPVNSPTPRVSWRSTSTNQQNIAFRYDTALGFTDESRALGDTLMLCMDGINFKDFEVRGYKSGAGWLLIKTVDNSTGLDDIGWTRSGNTVHPRSGGTDGQFYLHMNELEGATFALKDATGSAKLRKISTNTAGVWSGDASLKGKRPVILLDGVDGSERVTGTAGYVVPSRSCVLMNLENSEYSAFRITIKAQATADGYFEIGSLLLGWVSYHGQQPGWQRSITVTPNVSLDTRTDGTTFSIKHGPAARSVAFAWSEGIDTTALHESTIEPDYLQVYDPIIGADGPQVASVADVPGQMQGLAELLGSHRHVVYLPSISKRTVSTSEAFNRRDQFMIARVTSPVTLETIVGDELETELVRVGEVTLEEMV